MDLSKAFVSINHNLLIVKLHADGFKNDNLKLVGTGQKLTVNLGTGKR